VDIDELKKYLNFRMKTKTAIDDFVVMMYLLGNDFLPASPALGDLPLALEDALETYAHLVKKEGFKGFTRPEEVEINYPELNKFLTHLAAKESTLLQKLGERAPLKPLVPLDRAFVYEGGVRVFDLDVFRQGWYHRALVPRSKIEVPVLTDPALYSFQIEDVVDMTESYLTGMAWIYRYYRMGLGEINRGFLYPYFFAPLLTDMADFLTLVKPDFIPQDAEIKNDKKYHFSGLEQLLSILPLESRNLLPPEVQPLLEMQSPIIDYYPTKFEIDQQGVRKEHEGIVLLPFIDVERMHEAVASLNLPDAYLDQYNPVRVSIFQVERSSEKTESTGGMRGGMRGGTSGGMRGRGMRGQGYSRGGYRGGRGMGYAESRSRSESEGRSEVRSYSGGERGRGYSSRGDYSSTGERGRGYSSRGYSSRGYSSTRGYSSGSESMESSTIPRRGRGIYRGRGGMME
jgi:hypothetical protein